MNSLDTDINVNGFITTVSSYAGGIAIGIFKNNFIIGPTFDHCLTTILQWLCFGVTIIAGIYTIRKGHKRNKARKKTK